MENNQYEPRFPVFHVPHDGCEYPPELMRSVCVPLPEFDRYDAAMRDAGVEEFIPKAHRPAFNAVRFSISRLLCDPERFTGPEEPMEKYGMSFCYERAYDGKKIKNVTQELREQTLVYYREHHAQMDRLCEKYPRILLFDLHSYHDAIVPEPLFRRGVPTPDLCVGADEKYTPPELVESVLRRFEAAGFSVAVNYPYAGAFVPNAVLSGESKCDYVSVMLEFHKRVYCDNSFTPVPAMQDKIRDLIQDVLTDCVVL